MPLPTAVDANVTGLLDLFTYANTATNYFFWQAMLAVVFLVAFISLRQKNSTERSFAASGFLTGLLGIFFYGIGLVQEMGLLILLAVAIGGFVLLLSAKE